MLGWHALASSKSSRSWRSASPTHFDKQSAPLRMKNAATTAQGNVNHSTSFRALVTIKRQLTNFAAIGAAACGQGPREERFSCSRWTVEEHSPRGCDLEPLKHLRVKQRERNHFLELLDVAAHSSDRVKRDVGRDSERVSVGESCEGSIEQWEIGQ